jgi:predicted TIM-barrel fold metal-dependent hydrolase
MWWETPSETLDRSTSMLPGLLYERLDELGIDFALVYPSLALRLLALEDEQLRCATLRALNRMNAELFAPFRDRMLPVAALATHDPTVAVEELEAAVQQLGMQVVMIAGHVLRRTQDERRMPYVDTIGLDSPYDYDPFWRRCVELGVAVTDHGSGLDSPRRQSVSNYVFNHVGHRAETMHANAKALFLGGVVRRFPDLKFAFLECGVGWAASLVLDLESHWEKRNLEAMQAHLRPSNLDVDAFKALYRTYANGSLIGHEDDVVASMYLTAPFMSLEELSTREVDAIDDFAACGVGSKESLRAAFRENFYFGCEADDPMTAVATDPRLGLGLKAVFGSDVSHFDVTRMADVVAEAWEMVEEGLITEAEFERFAFTNGVELHTAGNPAFFEGTCLADAVKARSG